MKSDDFAKQNTLPDLHEGQTRFPVPSKIGPYKIESLLNHGGMSLLYLGSHPDRQTPIAIKVLLPKYVQNKEWTALFLKEAQIIKMANHPNIVQLYDHGQWDKGLYIAMEFIQGVSLRQFILQKSLHVRRALEIVLQVAYALLHLHTHGIIHRDLKPENILITESGEVKVIDFGVAMLRGEPAGKKRTIGTPVYMSPEQKVHGEIGPASDLYSLGMIAYELILGKLSHGAVHLSLLPDPLASIIGKALQEDVQMRYRDVVDFITDIGRYLKEMEEEGPQEGGNDELCKAMEYANALLIQDKAPQWNQLEVTFFVKESNAFSGLYLDFFHFNDNRYYIVVAEPAKKGAHALVSSLNFRGMVRAVLQKNNPVQILAKQLYEDPMKQAFHFTLLSLMPDQDQLRLISCQGAHLVQWGEAAARINTPPNGLLGEGPNGNLLETVDNWTYDDTLLLFTGSLEPTPEMKEMRAEEIGRKISSGKDQSIVVIRISRMY